jgi:hypothetical protein
MSERVIDPRITPKHVRGSVYFLERNELYNREKPYAFRYSVESEVVPQTNMNHTPVHNIPITDIRGSEAQFSIEENGFAILNHYSELPYEDFYNPQKVNLYLRELEKVLKGHLGAEQVEVFRYNV